MEVDTKQVLGIFSLRMRTNSYLGASGARFTKNHKSATYDKWNLWQTYDNGIGVFRKSYIITENKTKVFDAKLLYWFSLSAI